MSIKTDLENILGGDAVCSDPESISKYSSDQSFVEPCSPDVIAFAGSVEDVQQIVRYANKNNTPVVPCSSGLNLHGGTIPREGGIIVDLSRMNKILEINEDNWHCVIEPGVTVRQLQDELEKHQLRAMLPFCVHPDRSALTSFLERDPAVASASFEYGNELIMDTEIVLPDGDLYRTGLWSSGVKPGSPMGPVRAMINRLWTGAQGTFGILTKMNIKVEFLPKVRKVFLLQFNSLPEAIEPLNLIQRKEIGHECFLINNFNLAALSCSTWDVPEKIPTEMTDSSEFNSLREKLPPWMLVLCSNGGPRLPEGKIAYEEEALKQICSMARLQSYDSGELKKIMLDEILRPWGMMKKFHYRGAVHDICFKTTLKRVPEFQNIIIELTNKHNYSPADVGMAIIPVERGRAMHFVVDFHCTPDDSMEAEKVKRLWTETSQKLIDEGAFFDRPYGAWAEMLYNRSGTYAQKLKELKKELDPNNILNPGHLCF